jgi:uncharacterized protein
MNCRESCAACCIAPSISSAIPGMPLGKPAGVRCVQLSADLRCALFGSPLRPSEPMCGSGREHALRWLRHLERQTAPV